MTNKRLEYDPLKAVLQSLEPNIRIQLALRCPSLRSVEKLVPLKTQHLASSDNKVLINDTTYKLGIYRQYHYPAQTPRPHEQENESGGLSYEIDQWGFKTNPYEDPVTDGDINVQTPEPWNDVRNYPGIEEMYIRLVVIDREAMRRLAATGGREPPYIIPELQDLPNTEFFISREEMAIQYAMERPFADLQKTHNKYQKYLLPFYYRRANNLPPYTLLIQLTIESPNGKVIERVAKSKRICEAMKYLNTMFFGGRRHPIHVKELSLICNTITHRFPSDMRVRLRQIQYCEVDLEKLNDLIDPASYPLEVLSVQTHLRNSNQYEHDVARSAKKLVIINNCYGNDVPLVQTFKNDCIIVAYQSERYERQTFIDLIKNWLDSERTKGTVLTIGFRRHETITELLRLIRHQFEAVKMNERSLSLVLKSGSRLFVSCERFEDDPEFKNNAEFKMAEEGEESKWALKLIVV